MELYAIYERYQRDLIRFATSLTHSKEPAEDLVQQAYLKALDFLVLFENMHPEQIKGWFFTTIKRLFIDSYRRQQRFCDFPENELACDGFEGQLINRLVVQQALDLLSEEHRELVVLRYLSGYSAAKIAQMLHRNPSTIRSSLSVARAQFVKHLNMEAHHEKL